MANIENAVKSVDSLKNYVYRACNKLHVPSPVAPAKIYRGNKGPLFLMSKETAALHPSLTISEIIRNGSKKISDTEENKDALVLLEFIKRKMGSAEENLLHSDILTNAKTGINFDIIEKQAKSWGTNNGVPFELGFSTKRNSNWAANIFNNISETSYLLEIKPPKGQSFWTDRVGEITAGIMTKVSPDVLKDIPEDELVKSVCVKKQGIKKWYPAKPNEQLWKPYWNFVNRSTSYLSTVNKTTSLDDVINNLKKIYDDIFKT